VLVPIREQKKSVTRLQYLCNSILGAREKVQRNVFDFVLRSISSVWKTISIFVILVFCSNPRAKEKVRLQSKSNEKVQI
jgi:hypothetical protein